MTKRTRLSDDSVRLHVKAAVDAFAEADQAAVDAAFARPRSVMNRQAQPAKHEAAGREGRPLTSSGPSSAPT